MRRPITMQPVGKDQQSFCPKLLALESRRKLVWRGRVWIPWLFDGEHSFTIDRIDERRPQAAGRSRHRRRQMSLAETLDHY